MTSTATHQSQNQNQPICHLTASRTICHTKRKEHKNLDKSVYYHANRTIYYVYCPNILDCIAFHANDFQTVLFVFYCLRLINLITINHKHNAPFYCALTHLLLHISNVFQSNCIIIFHFYPAEIKEIIFIFALYYFSSIIIHLISLVTTTKPTLPSKLEE